MADILFDPIVHSALKSGDKTEARRTSGLAGVNKYPKHWKFKELRFNEDGNYGAIFKGRAIEIFVPFPFGCPGDRLHVKERYSNDPADAFMILGVDRVRMERLQQIRREDAIKEGIGHDTDLFKLYRSGPEGIHIYGHINDPIASFGSLWNAIHGPNAWDQNPWTWVLEISNPDLKSGKNA